MIIKMIFFLGSSSINMREYAFKVDDKTDLVVIKDDDTVVSRCEECGKEGEFDKEYVKEVCKRIYASINGQEEIDKKVKKEIRKRLKKIVLNS